MESKGKHGVREVESSRHILWYDQWRRIDEVATALRQTHPESFRRVQVRGRNGEKKEFWAFTKTVRLKRYGRKRIAMVHERADLTDKPRFLVTDALHWESGRIIETWSFRWAAEVFHEFSKQGTGWKRLRCAMRRRSNATPLKLPRAVAAPTRAYVARPLNSSRLPKGRYLWATLPHDHSRSVPLLTLTRETTLCGRVFM
jgi:hypothetical protein